MFTFKLKLKEKNREQNVVTDNHLAHREHKSSINKHITHVI